MARQRKRVSSGTQAPAPQATQVEDVVVVEVPNTNSANNSTNKGERKMAGLTAEQINSLMAGRSQKGQYARFIKSFLASGEAGIEVGVEWPELAEKKDTTVAQGFENAKKGKDAPEAWQNVRVIKNEGSVYLINQSDNGAEAAEDDE